MNPQDPVQRILRWFSYEHLAPEKQAISKQFHDLALSMAQVLPGGPEKTVALRKLLESKDAAVRASMDV